MKIVSRFNKNKVLFEAEATSITDLFKMAIKQGVSLAGANLTGLDFEEAKIAFSSID
jgi:uncharacterized protein YjbI with pentapeptide repeats